MKKMHRRNLALWLVTATVATSSAIAQADLRGYVRDTIDVVGQLPKPPEAGDPRAARDTHMYRQTRALLAGPRGALARSDEDTASRHMLEVFACSLDLSLTPDTAPATVALLRRASYEAMRSSTAAKQAFRHPRPVVQPGEPICAADGVQSDGYDYPSGHATLGWTWAKLLARVSPRQEEALLARGRAYGESRIVCGAHSVSGVEAGREAATVTLSTINREPAFARDLDNARQEIATLRVSPMSPRPDPAMCRQRATLIAALPLTGTTAGRSMGK